jgi:hypothetical protein
MPYYEREDWRKLCEAAAAEQDPKKLIALVEKLNAVLSEEPNRSKPPIDTTQPPAGK